MSPFFWEGGGGMRVGEVSERSVQQTHLGDCRCNYWWQLEAFFMALDDFYFSTLGLFTYTQCCADKPVWAGVGGGTCRIRGFLWCTCTATAYFKLPRWCHQTELGKGTHSWLRSQKLPAFPHGCLQLWFSKSLYSFITCPINNCSNEQTKMLNIYSMILILCSLMG